MLLLVKLVRCVVCVHALIPTAALTYQLYRREPRKNLLQSSPPGAPSTAPVASEEGDSSPAVPEGRAAAAPRPLCASPGLRAALRAFSSRQVSSPPPPRSAHPKPRRCAAPPGRRGRAADPAGSARRRCRPAAALRGGGRREVNAESWAGSAGRQRDALHPQPGGSAAFLRVCGPQPVREGAQADLLSAPRVPSSLQREETGEEPAPGSRGVEEQCAESGAAGEEEKKGPLLLVGSCQISPNLLGGLQNHGPVAPTCWLLELKWVVHVEENWTLPAW